MAATNPWVRVAVDPPFGAVCTAYWNYDVSTATYYIELVYEGPDGPVRGIVNRTAFGVYPAFQLTQVVVGDGTVTLYPTVNYPDGRLIYQGSYRPVLFRSAPAADLELLTDQPDAFSAVDLREILRAGATSWCEEAPQFIALAGFKK